MEEPNTKKAYTGGERGDVPGPAGGERVTKEQLAGIKRRLDAKRGTCGGVNAKYGEAFRDGLSAAQSALDAHAGESPGDIQAALRRLLGTSPYLSGNKKDAYGRAVKAATSMVHELES